MRNLSNCGELIPLVTAHTSGVRWGPPLARRHRTDEGDLCLRLKALLSWEKPRDSSGAGVLGGGVAAAAAGPWGGVAPAGRGPLCRCRGRCQVGIGGSRGAVLPAQTSDPGSCARWVPGSAHAAQRRAREGTEGHLCGWGWPCKPEREGPLGSDGRRRWPRVRWRGLHASAVAGEQMSAAPASRGARSPPWVPRGRAVGPRGPRRGASRAAPLHGLTWRLCPEHPCPWGPSVFRQGRRPYRPRPTP